MKVSSLVRSTLLLGLLLCRVPSVYSTDWWGVKPSAPGTVAPAVLDNSDFYFYAQKQAELYRGELMTYSEMKRFAQQTKEQIRQWNVKHPGGQGSVSVLKHLESLEAKPYSIEINRTTLNSIDALSDKGPLEVLEKSLQVHLIRLQSIADSYQE